MKKGLVMILLAITVISGVVFWLANTGNPINAGEIAMFGAILFVVGFAVFVAVKRIQSNKAGLKPEDELSKKIMQRTASLSYYISLYWWLFLMYYSEKLKLESHSIIGLGILGMAVLFAGLWFYFNYRGKFNE